MKRQLLTISLICFTGAASAQDYFSVGFESAKAKYSNYEFVNPRITDMVQDHDKSSITNLSVAYGRQFDGFRGELELVMGSKAEFTSYHAPFEINAQTKEVTSHRLMGNIYKDFDTVYALKPFIGASLGLAYNTAEGFQGANRDAFDKKSVLALAYGVSVGARYSLDKTSNASIAYQYVNAGEADTGISLFAPNDERFKGKFVTTGVKLLFAKNF